MSFQFIERVPVCRTVSVGFTKFSDPVVVFSSRGREAGGGKSRMEPEVGRHIPGNRRTATRGVVTLGTIQV